MTGSGSFSKTKSRPRITGMSIRDWPALPDPLPPPEGGDLRNNRKGKFSVGQKFDVDASLRAVAILRLKSEGKSFAEIAEMLGYNSDDAVRVAYHSAAKKYLAFQATEWAKVILQQHVDDIARIDEVIADPGYKTDVKGSLVTGPDGEYLADENVRVQALTERRKTLESIRRMAGTDAPKRTELSVQMDEQLNERIRVTVEKVQELLGSRKPAVITLPDDEVVEGDVIDES